MGEDGRLREALLADVQPDTGVGAGAVPVAPVAGEVAERLGNLLGLGFQLLQADDVRLVARMPFTFQVAMRMRLSA
jgi:hypothetical protein